MSPVRSAERPDDRAVRAPTLSTARIDGVLSGVKWLGRDDQLQRSRTAGLDYGPLLPEPMTDFRPVDADQLATIHAILTGAGLPAEFAGFSVEGVTGLRCATPAADQRRDPALREHQRRRDGLRLLSRTTTPIGGDVFFGGVGRRAGARRLRPP